jgi:hypothetical protein
MGAKLDKAKNMFKVCGCGPEARELVAQKKKELEI